MICAVFRLEFARIVAKSGRDAMEPNTAAFLSVFTTIAHTMIIASVRESYQKTTGLLIALWSGVVLMPTDFAIRKWQHPTS